MRLLKACTQPPEIWNNRERGQQRRRECALVVQRAYHCHVARRYHALCQRCAPLHPPAPTATSLLLDVRVQGRLWRVAACLTLCRMAVALRDRLAAAHRMRTLKVSSVTALQCAVRKHRAQRLKALRLGQQQDQHNKEEWDYLVMSKAVALQRAWRQRYFCTAPSFSMFTLCVWAEQA